MPKTTLIFDLDGTMIDSESVAYIAWRDALRLHGVDFTEEDNLFLVGMRLEEALAFTLRRFQLSVSAETLYHDLATMWEKASENGFEPMPGLFELVDALGQRNIRWGVATASTHDVAVNSIRALGLADICQAIAGGDEVVHSKPAPDVYQLCAQRLNVQPNQCLAIEDSIPGHQSAAAAGMTVIAIPNKWTDPSRYTQADVVYTSLNDVVTHLDHLLE